ncbi:MAG: response regulator, partial [Kocuria sp.]|nr:response regulator [Kocuria sp.]
MRLLIVDDEVDLSESLRRGLTNEGFVVDVANDGITGAWLAQENPYDVIVLDLML